MADCPECGGSGWVSPNYRRGACCDCEALSDLLQEHGVDGLKQLAEAGVKLPRTADGVRVVPFMDLYLPRPDGLVVRLRTLRGWNKHIAPDPGHAFNGSHESICFSTKEAALKALNKEKGE